jgi:type IV pilus assembly protein PilO
MKLTNREAFLLKLTGLVLLLALSYYFVISPEMDKLSVAREQFEVKTSEVETVKAEIAAMPQLDSEIDNLQKSIVQSSQRFLPEIQQKKLIIMLDEQLRESNAMADSIGFSQITLAENQPTKDPSANSSNNQPTGNGDTTVVAESLELNIESMSVQAPLLGRYEEIMTFINLLEIQNRTIVINSLQLSKGTDGNISGSIGLDFYAMNKLTEDPQDENYLSWPYNTPKGIDNPFPYVPSDDPNIEEPPVEETNEVETETPAG